MTSLLTKILGDKKQWKAMEARANMLPPRLPDRVWRDEVLHVQVRYRRRRGRGCRSRGDPRTVRERRGAHGRGVLDVTGEDVAAFCHGHLRGMTSYLDRRRASLNRDVVHKLA